MNGQIVISVAIAFFIVFSSLLVLDYVFLDPDTKNHYFFLQENKDKKILILGSSHVGILNTTLIDELVLENSDYNVFNLGYSNDKPEKRFEILQEMISLEPEIVFYGISYRDFGYHQYEDQFIPKKSMMMEKLLGMQNHEINPKLNTLKAIKSIFTENNSEINEHSTDTKTIIHTNAPFFPIQSYYTDTASESDLRRDGNVFIASQIYIEPENNSQVENFKTIIDEFQNKDIKVVLFVIPHHTFYLDAITPDTKQTFEKILKEINNEFNVKIYDFQKKYIDFPYWYDVEHVAYVPGAMEYSKEIANMINSEIDS
jgi:hypothetical protein